MLQMRLPKMEEDILASSLRKQQTQLQEVIDAIERRDIDSEQVRLSLGTLATSLVQIRKRLPVQLGSQF